MTNPTQTAAPVRPGDRYASMDVLRGFALFGVFLANLVGFVGFLMASEAQLAALPTVEIDGLVDLAYRILVLDKANTLFAVLFGIGFSIQLQRLSARGADFNRIYLRRLTVLLLMGIVHQLFFWAWDILHMYALMGFALYTTRSWSNRSLLLIGIPLLLLARPIQKTIDAMISSDGPALGESFIGDEAALARQAMSESGDYWGLVENFAGYYWADFTSGMILAWLLYVFGRFLIGQWIGRRDYVTHPERYLAGMRRILRTWFPLGLLLAVLGCLPYLVEDPAWFPAALDYQVTADWLHLMATPMIALGYACMILLGLQGGFWKPMLSSLAAVGRMALTNYLMQSLVYAFVLFDLGFGLGLAGQFGSAIAALIVIGFFGFQIAFSNLWLRHFRYGPVEWLWRALTYWNLPAMRLAKG